MNVKQTFVFVLAMAGYMGSVSAQQTEAAATRTPTVDNAIEFVEGETRHVERRSKSAIMPIMAEFETEPIHTNELRMHHILRDVFRAGDIRAIGLHDLQPHRYIVRTPTPAEAPTKDLWIVYAPDDRTLRELIAEMDRRILAWQKAFVGINRDSLMRDQKNLDDLCEKLPYTERQLSDQQAQYDEVKINGFTVDASDSLTADLVRESRLVEIDVVGLEAQLAEIRKRLGNRDQSARVPRDQLTSMQVRLDIELIGKTARRAVINRQIHQIMQAVQRLSLMQSTEQSLQQQRRMILRIEKNIESAKSFLDRVKRKPGLPIIGNRVTVHRIIVDEDKD